MGYINFNKCEVVLLTEFEAAALVVWYEQLNRRDWFGGSSVDDVLLHGANACLICPLTDDQFGRWFVEPMEGRGMYDTEQITNGRPLYFVPLNEDTVRSLHMFSNDWLSHRKYVLRYTER